MEEAYIFCESDIASFWLCDRCPFEPNEPIEELRFQFHGSDCAAGESVESQNWGEFVDLFRDVHSCEELNWKRAWTSSSGKLFVRVQWTELEDRYRTFWELDGLREFNHWKVQVDFVLSPELLRQNYLRTRMFIGSCGRSNFSGLFPMFKESPLDYRNRLLTEFDSGQLAAYDLETYNNGLEWAKLEIPNVENDPQIRE